MAGGKGAKTGVKAAGKTAGAAPKAKWKGMTPATHKFTDLGDEGKAHYTALGNQMGMDAVAAWRLETQLRPELEAAGYTPAEIKKAMGQGGDSFANLQTFVADERERLISEILASPAGYDRTVLDNANLRDLWGTYEDVVVSGKPQPSNIRGKDPNASQAVESRTAGADTASTPAPQLAEPPKGGAAPEKPLTPKEQKKLAAAKAKEEAERRMAGNAAAAKEGDFGGVDWMGSNKDPRWANNEASTGNWAALSRADLAGRNIEPGPGAYVPGQAGAKAPPPPEPPKPAEPSPALKNSRVARTVTAVGSSMKNNPIDWLTAIGAGGLITAGGLALSRSGTSAPAPAQGQQPAGPYRPPMSFEEMQRIQQDRRNRSMPPPAGPAPLPAQPSGDQSTDIIRAMMMNRRMA